jgi:hypothetical protein
MNFLLTIRSVFRGEGTAAATKELDRLRTQTLTKLDSTNQTQTLAPYESSVKKTTEATKELNKASRGTATAISALHQVANGNVLGGLRMAAEAASEKFGQLGVKIGAAFAAFGVGFQIGSMIREITGLGKALDRLLVQPPLISNSIRDMSNIRLAGLKSELEGLKTLFESLAKDASTAAGRIATVLESKLAAELQPMQEKLIAAPPEQRPVIKAEMRVVETKTRQDIAEATYAEDIKARAAAEAKLADLRARLKAAVDQQTTLEEKANTPNPFTGEKDRQSVAQLVELRAAREQVAMFETETLRLSNAILAVQEKEIQSQTALTNAVMATKAAEQDVLDLRKQTSDVAEKESAKKSNEHFDDLLDDWNDEGKRLDQELAARMAAKKDQIQEDAQKANQAAADQKDFAAQTQQKADAARERFFNPAIAKQEAQAAKEKANQDQRLSRMAARARAAGYELQQGPGGEFNAVKTGNLGPTSKRLAEALELEAKRKFAEQQKRDAERLVADAAKAQIEAAKLLAQIEQNTKAGPVV